MNSLKIKDCSFAFKGHYDAPRAFETTNLHRIAAGFLSEFSGYGLDSNGISLDSGDKLFRYALRAALFNRLMSITLSAPTLEVNCTMLRGAPDRRLALECITKTIAVCGEGLSQECFIELGVHAAFASQELRDQFFSVNAPESFESRGHLAYKKAPGAGGMIRVEIDKSWVFDDAAYISWRTIGMQLAEFTKSGATLFEILFASLRPFSLELTDE